MNPSVRRLLAFAIDYVVIAAYLLILAAASLVVLASSGNAHDQALWADAWSAEIAGFVLLTAPVVLYFAALESSSSGATLGKRVLHLRVVATGGGRLGFGRSLVRSGIKFLPWELAHFTIWQYVYGARTGGAPGWAPIALAAVYVLVGVYILSLLVGKSHRTIYDRAAGSMVVRAAPQLAGAAS
jgi:uncharacterized RDD family membrane protein YckC